MTWLLPVAFALTAGPALAFEGWLSVRAAKSSQ